MDLAWIRTFTTVADRRSFTRAAEELHLSQPAVSRQVQKLEEELGVELIDRSAGSVVLTPEGDRFRKYARQALQEFNRVLEEIREGEDQLRGPLNIAASTIPGEFLAPDLAFQFTELYPDIEPSISIGDSTSVIEQLRSGSFDVGFVGVKLINQQIQYWAVADDEVVLAVPASHEFVRRSEIELSDLNGQPFIEREPGSGTAISVRRALSKYGHHMPKYRKVMRLSSTEAVLSAIESGHGIGWVSSLALTHRQPRRIKTVKVSGLSVVRTLYLATSAQRSLSPIALAFVDWVIHSRN